MTGVQIEKIYKDSTGELKAEDRMTILENEAYDKETGVTYHIAGYNRQFCLKSELSLFKSDKECTGMHEIEAGASIDASPSILSFMTS